MPTLLALLLCALLVHAPAAASAPLAVRTAHHAIPDDFPLLDGYPPDRRAEDDGYGRHGPSRTMKPLRFDACGRQVGAPRGVERLRGGWTNPEDFRERELLAFRTADRAQGYVRGVLHLFAACPEDGPRDDRRSTTVAHRTITTTYAYRGTPRPGIQVTHMVRVGTAVLLATTYNEGGAGSHPEQEAAAERRRTAREIEDVVEAMARFRTTPK
ncbi:hypothetical protein ABLE68_02845 [Nocardioides sp. CN2-186]|uniref:hypothetical protein n=1 Tax=Nocardioides tweenelious TaxID=3156607 RepID=UPI0032B5677A